MKHAARKRLFDVAVAAPVLLMALPLLALAAGAIVATSRGPAIHRAVRIGRFGRPFTMWKLRSMEAHPAGGPGGGPAITAPGDPRITRVGAFLRRTQIDELPQLVNVLRGEMSLVGPRPEAPEIPPPPWSARRGSSDGTARLPAPG